MQTFYAGCLLLIYNRDSKLQPTAQMRPAKPFHPAHKAILSMMKKQYVDEKFVIWWNATFPETITSRKKFNPQTIV